MFIKAYLIGQCLSGEIEDTYVQQYSKWKNFSREVRATFMEGVKPNSIDKVALHIRRGDYLEHTNIYVDLTVTDYYKKAVKTFPDAEFLVFCKDNQGWDQDKADRQWCREYLDTFIPGRYELVSKDNKEEDDMNMMASCIARIGANSSFSWMACFLAGANNIMPKQWFVEGAQAQPVEIPPEWTLL